MPKPRKVYKVAERRAERARALGGSAYEIEGLDGEIVEVPFMSFWSEALTKKVYGDNYPGDMEVLRLAISETWPEEPERLEAFERLGLQLGDTVEIITEVMRYKPGSENDPDDPDDADADDSGVEGGDEPALATAKTKTAAKTKGEAGAGGAGKSRSSSTRSRSTARS